MRSELTIPFTLVEYAEWHQIDPEEYAQAVLDEKGREIAPLIMGGRQQLARQSLCTGRTRRVNLAVSERRWS